MKTVLEQNYTPTHLQPQLQFTGFRAMAPEAIYSTFRIDLGERLSV